MACSTACYSERKDKVKVAAAVKIQALLRGATGRKAARRVKRNRDVRISVIKALGFHGDISRWPKDDIPFIEKAANQIKAKQINDYLFNNKSIERGGAATKAEKLKTIMEWWESQVAAASVAPSDRRTVVLSLDYDNCMDVLFEGAALRLERRSMKRERTIMEDVRTNLKEYIQRITSGALRVVIMVGSNRQSIGVDTYNRNRLEREVGPVGEKIGWARLDLEQFATENGWDLNRTLLADKENNAPPGTAWNDSSLDIKFQPGMDEDIKKRLIEYQFEQLHTVEGPVEFYFFDDVKRYLDHVRRTVVAPERIKFSTVHFDWFSHVVENKPMDLYAESQSPGA